MASANINDKLIIFRGDDTGGTFGRRLAFTIDAESGVSLDGCRAEWVFDGITKEIPAPLVPGEVREIFYSHNETRCMALGVRYGDFRIVDSAGKVRTITNTKAVEVTDNVSRCYPGTSSASFVVRGIGDVRHSEFADLETKDGMTLKEVGTMVNTLIRKLKGTVASLAALLALSSFSEGLGPQTEFGDVPPSATLTQVVTAGGGCGGGVDTNTVREIAGEVVAPVEAAVADRYTKSEADAKFVPNDGQFNVGSDWMPFWNSQPLFYHDLGDVWVINPDRMHYSWRGIRGTPTTLSGYCITDAKIESGTIYLGSQSITPIVNGGSGSMSTLSVTGDSLESFAPIYKRNPLDGSSSEVVYGISTNGTDYAHANVNLKPWGDSLISSSNPAFSNAVLAVGIDTNAVAQIGELKEFFDGLPVGTVGTSLGGIILALLAAVSWLKKNALTDGLETDGTPTDVKLDKFFTNSNSLLNARITYERNSTGLKDRAFNALTFDGTEYNLSAALASVTPTSDGQPRDLLIVATATAATTISYTAGTIKGDKPTIDGSGTWLITLTEYAANTWYCRQIKMEDAQ